MIEHLGGGHGAGDLLSLAREIDEESHTVGVDVTVFALRSRRNEITVIAGKVGLESRLWCGEIRAVVKNHQLIGSKR